VLLALLLEESPKWKLLAMVMEEIHKERKSSGTGQKGQNCGE